VDVVVDNRDELELVGEGVVVSGSATESVKVKCGGSG